MARRQDTSPADRARTTQSVDDRALPSFGELFGALSPSPVTRPHKHAEPPIVPLLRAVVDDDVHFSLVEQDVTSCVVFMQIPTHSRRPALEVVRAVHQKLSEKYAADQISIFPLIVEGRVTLRQSVVVQALHVKYPAIGRISFDSLEVEISQAKEGGDPGGSQIETVIRGEFKTLCGGSIGISYCREPWAKEFQGAAALTASGTKMATKFWVGNKGKLDGRNLTNSIEIDRAGKILTLFQGDLPNAAGVKSRREGRILVDVIGFGMGVSVVAEPSIASVVRSLQSSITISPAHVKFQARDDKLFLSLLLSEKERDVATQALTRLKRELREHWDLNLIASVVKNENEITQLLFESVPIDSGLFGVDISSNGKRLLIRSLSPDGFTLPKELRTKLESLFPEGIFFRSESEIAVMRDDPLYAAVFRALPSNCDVRGVSRCRVSDRLIVHLRHPPSEELLRATAVAFGSELVVKVHPSPDPPKVISPVVQWLAQPRPPIPRISRPPRKSDRAMVGFGGCRMVGGSRFVVSLGGYRLLLDCGGRPNHSSSSEKGRVKRPSSKALSFIDMGFVTHGHLDHSEETAIDFLRNPTTPFLMTRPTALIMYQRIRESARRISVKSGLRVTPQIIEKMYRENLHIIPYDVPIQIADTLRVTAIDAGHLAGSAQLLFESSDLEYPHRLLYSGDYRTAQSRLHDGARQVDPVDTLIVEGTYGMRSQTDRKSEEEALKNNVRRIILSGGNCVFPLLTTGRAQEILSILCDDINWYKENNVRAQIRGSLPSVNDLFAFLVRDDIDTFSRRVSPALPEWLQFNALMSKHPTSCLSTRGGGGQLIFVPGGMVDGGARAAVNEIQHDPNSGVFLTCHQSPRTCGARILEFHKHGTGRDGEFRDFKAQIFNPQLSAHSPGEEALAFVERTLKPGGKVLIVHGDEPQLLDFAAAICSTGITAKENVIVPRVFDKILF